MVSVVFSGGELVLEQEVLVVSVELVLQQQVVVVSSWGPHSKG